ncbi:hypothetical protein [Thermoflexus sp.]
MVGWRDILVHENALVDRTGLYSLWERIDGCQRFIEQIGPYLR